MKHFSLVNKIIFDKQNLLFSKPLNYNANFVYLNTQIEVKTPNIRLTGIKSIIRACGGNKLSKFVGINKEFVCQSVWIL